MPPSNHKNIGKSFFLRKLFDFLEYLTPLSGKLLITGDFNVYVDQSSTADAKQFEDILHSFGLAQHVDSCTHIRGKILDLILSHSSDSLVHSCVVSYRILDHHAVHAMIESGNPHRPQKTVTY